MRNCIQTKQPFNPQSEEQYFANVEAFDAFLNKLDPMDEFQPQKREVKWSSFERQCASCGNEYVSNHPASMYCEPCTHATKEKKPVERKTPLEYFQLSTTIKECKKCQTNFEARTTAMLYCEHCSPKGGKVVSPR